MFLRRSKQEQQGASTVEFALCAPVFFLFIFALFEFTWTNVIRHTADNAAYEAARHAMVPGATVDDARAEAARILRIVGTRGAVIDITPPVIEPDTEQVQVDIRIPMDQNGLIAPRFTSGIHIEAQSTLRTERVETR